MRLDHATAIRFGLSRRAAREAVRAGRVDWNGVTRDEPGLEVPDGAPLAFHPGRPARRRVRTRLSVLLEDDEFVIVEKPPDLLSVPTAEREKDTLLSRVSTYLQHRYRRRPYVGVVHRLDRDTSGALVFARTRPALRFLQERFRAHEIDREYLALVQGLVPERGTFDRGLTGDGVVRRRGVARPGEAGRRAVTRYRRIEALPGASLVSVELETGRTHQIRIHFAAAGHPVLGDRVYRRAESPAPSDEIPRQMLHARRLAFPHPRTGAQVKAEAPLPEDFEAAISRLRRGRPAAAERKKRPDLSGRSRVRKRGS